LSDADNVDILLNMWLLNIASVLWHPWLHWVTSPDTGGTSGCDRGGRGTEAAIDQHSVCLRLHKHTCAKPTFSVSLIDHNFYNTYIIGLTCLLYLTLQTMNSFCLTKVQNRST